MDHHMCLTVCVPSVYAWLPSSWRPIDWPQSGWHRVQQRNQFNLHSVVLFLKESNGSDGPSINRFRWFSLLISGPQSSHSCRTYSLFAHQREMIKHANWWSNTVRISLYYYSCKRLWKSKASPFNRWKRRCCSAVDRSIGVESFDLKLRKWPPVEVFFFVLKMTAVYSGK